MHCESQINFSYIPPGPAQPIHVDSYSRNTLRSYQLSWLPINIPFSFPLLYFNFYNFIPVAIPVIPSLFRHAWDLALLTACLSWGRCPRWKVRTFLVGTTVGASFGHLQVGLPWPSWLSMEKAPPSTWRPSRQVDLDLVLAVARGGEKRGL